MSKHIDYSLLLVIVLLTFIGVLMVFSSSFYYALNRMNDMYHFFTKGLMLAGLGFAVMLVVMRIDYRRFEKWSVPLMVVAFVLLVLVLTKFGVKVNGARRWLSIGSIPLMPSEVAKMALVLFFARLIKHNQKQMSKFGTVLLFCVIIALFSGLIILQPNYSTAMILALGLFVMLFLGGAKIWHLTVLAFAGGSAALTIAFLMSYRIERIVAFLNPTTDVMGDNWQAVQSLYALGSGGLIGVGLGQSTQNKLYIPEPQNDFIFSTIGEELGLVGTLVVALLFITLIWRGYRAAMRCKDPFGALVAAGMTTMIAIQAVINISVTTKLIPVTGVPLPFISSGGSSLIFLLMQMGILLNISKTSTQSED